MKVAHLCASQIVQAGPLPLTFVSGEGILLATAEAEGLVVENPNSHP